MNLTKIGFVVFLMTALLSCQKGIYDSSVQDYGQLAINIQPENNVVCDHIVVVIPDVDTVEFSGSSIIVDSIPSGTHKVIVYSKTDKCIADGCLITSLDINEKFYAASTSYYVKPSEVNQLNLQLSERSHEIQYEITCPYQADYIAVEVYNVSSSVDLEFNRLMYPDVARLKLEQSEARVFAGGLIYLGIIGTEFRMTFSIYKGDEMIASSELRFPMNMIGYSSLSDIHLKVDLSENSKTAEIVTQGGNWMISLGSVDINNNLNN